MGGIAEQVGREVAAWPGVEAGPHRFGGVEFRLAAALALFRTSYDRPAARPRRGGPVLPDSRGEKE